MFTTLGWSSWLVPPALLVINGLLFRRRTLPDRVSPSIGFALVLLVAAATIHKLAPTLRPSPPVGSGGYLGALTAVFLELHFGNAGLILILGAAGLFGLALCHELLIAWPWQEARGWLGRLRSRVGVAAPASGELMRIASGDWDDPMVLADATGTAETRVHPPIPVHGSAGTILAPGLPPHAIAGPRARGRADPAAIRRVGLAGLGLHVAANGSARAARRLPDPGARGQDP